MLKKGSIEQLRAGELIRAQGYIVLPMCHYPRGLSKKLIDEYVKNLGPSKALLDAFHAERERLGGNHNAAFLSSHYQKNFTLAPEGIVELKRLSELSRERDVYFVCQCALNQRCHRELLLICAKRWWRAATELRTFSYAEFEARLSNTANEFAA